MLIGKSEFAISLPTNSTLSDVVRTLSSNFPAMVGEVIEADQSNLIPTNVISINGKQIIHEKEMHTQPRDGDRLILLSLLAGG